MRMCTNSYGGFGSSSTFSGNTPKNHFTLHTSSFSPAKTSENTFTYAGLSKYLLINWYLSRKV